MGLTLDTLVVIIKNCRDSNGASKDNGFDQLNYVIDLIKNDPIVGA